LIRDPAVLSEGILTQAPSGMTFVGAPFNLEGVPGEPGDAPDFAADTFEVLTGLGLTPEQIAALEQ
jgi:hypothetical protein